MCTFDVPLAMLKRLDIATLNDPMKLFLTTFFVALFTAKVENTIVYVVCVFFMRSFLVIYLSPVLSTYLLLFLFVCGLFLWEPIFFVSIRQSACNMRD